MPGVGQPASGSGASTPSRTMRTWPGCPWFDGLPPAGSPAAARVLGDQQVAVRRERDVARALEPFGDGDEPHAEQLAGRALALRLAVRRARSRHPRVEHERVGRRAAVALARRGRVGRCARRAALRKHEQHRQQRWSSRRSCMFGSCTSLSLRSPRTRAALTPRPEVHNPRRQARADWAQNLRPFRRRVNASCARERATQYALGGSVGVTVLDAAARARLSSARTR